MKYYLNTRDGKKEVKFGDTIVLTKEKKGKNYAYVTKESFTFNANNVEELIKDSIIEAIPVKLNPIDMDIKKYMPNGTVHLSNTMMLNYILDKIAKILDKKYPDHISNSKDIYVISTLNGKITKVNKAVVKNYKNFAAFRTIEDAKIACKICSPLLREMYHE